MSWCDFAAGWVGGISDHGHLKLSNSCSFLCTTKFKLLVFWNRFRKSETYSKILFNEQADKNIETHLGILKTISGTLIGS